MPRYVRPFLLLHWLCPISLLLLRQIIPDMVKHMVQVGDIACGADPLFLISGPCVIESESIMMQAAEKLQSVSESLNIPVIYKSSFLK
ncbi:MAG: hypothetical protein AAFQ92_20840, partial [Bacteroidota bacterium]